MTEPTVLYAEQGAVAIATLNRPQSLNSFNRQMHHDLWVALDKAESNTTIRALVITGAGRGFCAGADLSDFDFTPGPDMVQRLGFRDGAGQCLAQGGQVQRAAQVQILPRI